MLLGGLTGRRIALLGLTYKPGTDTLRRSYALELARMLIDAGAAVSAFDPVISRWPDGFDLPIELAGSTAEVLQDADAAVITTEWPQFRDEDWPALIKAMARPILIDPKGHLRARRSEFDGITYAIVGWTSPAGQARGTNS
jgi:UDPglucose 6-dehydrogenase